MARGLHRLPLEKPIYEIEDKIADLETAPLGQQSQEEVQQLRRECADLQKQIFGNLDPWQTVEVARHPNRPKTSDYLSLVFDEFVELHGDKAFGDDPAMLTGFAKIDRHKVLVIGHQKGKTLAEKQACHFGCAHPEGYRKAMGKMRLAAKYGLPVICLIDTPGAYPGVGAEERGQAQVIAESMFLMASLKVPIICVVIGEGGLVERWESVLVTVSLFLNMPITALSARRAAPVSSGKAAEFKADAARALRMRAWDLKEFGVIDKVIDEPRGGAHRDPRLMAARLKTFLERTLKELGSLPIEKLVENRYEKFRRMGAFLES